MDRELFVQNVKKYCELAGIKPTVACRECKVGTSFINNIERRNQTPSVEKVQMLAQYLGVTTSELLGEEEKPTPTYGDGLTPEFIRLYEQLSKTEKEFVVKQMRGLLSQE